MDLAIIVALGLVLFVVPSRLDRWAVARGASPRTLAVLAAVTLAGLVAVPVAFVVCTGVLGVSGHSDRLRVVAVAALLFVAVAAARAVARVAHVRRCWLRLAATASALRLPRTAEGVIVLPVAETLAFVAGTEAYVSKGLLERLPPGQSSAVVAHERAHQAAGHARLMSAAGAITHGLFGLRPARAAEQALYRELDALADRAASRATDDPAAVAQALREIAHSADTDHDIDLRLARIHGRHRASSSVDAIVRLAAMLLALLVLAAVCVALNVGNGLLGVLACSVAVVAFVYFARPLVLESSRPRTPRRA